MSETDPTPSSPAPHKRRKRYAGKNPRKFEDKYKEHNPERYGGDVAKVIASGKTPAGSHRPIMVAEILAALALQPGETVVDCTLGYGGHTREMLAKITPKGRLIGLDVDPLRPVHEQAASWGPRRADTGAPSPSRCSSMTSAMLAPVSAPIQR